MSTRPALTHLLVFVLVLAVCTSSIWLVPAGHGSFSAVHGPNSSFMGKRAAGRALSFISTTPVVALLQVVTSRTNTVSDFALSPFDHLPVICILTC